MQFGNPQAFWLLLLLPAAVAFFAWAERRKRTALLGLGDAPLVARLGESASPIRDRVKSALLLGGLFFMVLAHARPQWGQEAEEVVRSGVDVLLVLDTSSSMDATDVRPSRLEKARELVKSLIDRLEGNRIGLVVFAGDAFVQSPLTLDYRAAKIFLDAVDSGIVPEPGTNVARALEVAADRFESQQSKHKVVVLLTDGEQHEGDPDRAAREAREAGILVHAIGLGTPAGDPIPIRNRAGEVVDTKKDESGRPVTSRLDEETLRRIALLTGGTYFRASDRESEIDEVAELIAGMEKEELASRLYARYRERFYWPLGLAIAALAAEIAVPRRRVSRRTA